MATYLIVYIGAVLLSLAATFLAIRLAPRIGAVDQPGPRKVHTAPIPRIGGLAIFTAMIVSAVSAALVDRGVCEKVGRNLLQMTGFLAAGAFVLGVGVVDDIRGLRARQKLIAELAAAAVVCALGIRIESLGEKGVFWIEFGWLSWPVTILWLVGITNSVNLIDGMDGLAAGISAITCAVIAAIAWHAQYTAMAVLMLAMLGGLTGFLFFNFNPARIFLGDSGSLFLGFMLAGASVLCSAKAATIIGVGLPLLAMGVPVFDTLSSMVRRALERSPLFAPDGRHIHHRLMKMGLRHRHIVLVLYGITALSAGLGMFMMVTSRSRALVIFFCVLLLMGVFLRLAGVFRLGEASDALRRLMTLSRETRKDKRSFQDARLRLREVHTLRGFWRVLTETAEGMGAVRVAMVRKDKFGVNRTVLRHHSQDWRGSFDAVRLTIPLPDRLGGSGLRLEMDIPVGDSLEAIGRRLELFGRLIDENIGSVAGPADAAPSQPQENAETLGKKVA